MKRFRTGRFRISLGQAGLTRKGRGETFWVYATVLNSGPPQRVRVGFTIFERATGTGHGSVASDPLELASGESHEFASYLDIREDMAPGMYDVSITAFEDIEGQDLQVRAKYYEESMLEIIAMEKEITAVRYA